MKEAEEVIRMMNQAGAEGSPFVFGLDFELCRGFFIPNPFEQQEVLFDFHGFSNCRPRATTSSSYRFNKYPKRKLNTLTASPSYVKVYFGAIPF